MRFALDSNVFVYSFIRDDPERHSAAAELIRLSADADCVLPLQVVGEFLNAIRRKQPKLFSDACAQAERWCSVLPIAETRVPDMIAGAQLARRFHLQFWDSVLCAVAQTAGAEVLLTEDMQDGQTIDGLRIINPFAEVNREMLLELLLPLENR